MNDQTYYELLDYARSSGLLNRRDEIYALNRLLALMRQDSVEPRTIEEKKPERPLNEILNEFLDEAAAKGLIEDSITFRDLFDAKIMDALMDRPSTIQDKFEALYREDPKKATDWYYDLSQNSNYIRRDRIAKDLRWNAQTPYGEMEMSINLSKPEKDPKAIAAARSMPSSAYPKCALCLENEGYAGRANHPGRSNHRVIELDLAGAPFAFQYSPYVYFNEHSIVFNQNHVPMVINYDTFKRLLSFVEKFPHYFLGSNADLPIVGGSILSHDHFQGGSHTFPIQKAKEEKEFVVPGFEDVHAAVVDWPLTTLRIRSKDPKRLAKLADHILKKWRDYTDEEAMIYANTDGVPHNTITPIARRNQDEFEMDLVLRNNLTTDEHPLGLYHPHAKWHHIKKENIGLIEVMGLAVLPARLKDEMSRMKKAILAGEDLDADASLKAHAEWAKEIVVSHPELNADTIDAIVDQEIGTVFSHVLEDAGVYKTDPESRKALDRFLATL